MHRRHIRTFLRRRPCHPLIRTISGTSAVRRVPPPRPADRDRDAPQQVRTVRPSPAIAAWGAGWAAADPARLVQTVGTTGWKNRSTTLTVSSSANPSTLGSSVVLTASVTGSTASMPTGRVLFMLDGEVGGDPAGVVITPVSGSTARATLTLSSSLAHGRRTITATYRADSNYKGSTAAITQPVN